MLVESRLGRADRAKKAGPGVPAPCPTARWALLASLGCVLALGACANDPPQQTSYQGQHRPQVATADGTPRRFSPPTDPSQDSPLVKTTPRESAATMAKLGQRSLDEGSLDSAHQMFQRSLALEPNSLPTTLGLAETFYRMDDFPAALETYRKALRLDPVNDDALRGAGKTLIALDRPKEAIEIYHKARVRRPGDARIFNGLGVGMDMAGDHSGAQQQYRKALTLAAADPNVQNNLGLSLALSGSYNESIEILTSLVSSPRATARNRQNLALVYGLMGNDERASYYARQDLSDEQVQRNLAYYAQLRMSTDKARAAAAFGVDSRRGVQLPAPGPMEPAPPRLPTTSEGETVPALPMVAPAAGTAGVSDQPAALVPVPPAGAATIVAPDMASKDTAAAMTVEPRKAEVVDATPAAGATTVGSEPSSLRSFLSKVLSAPAEQPPPNATVAAGDDPERSIDSRQPK